MKALSYGFSLEYEELAEFMSEDMPIEVCKEVIDILQMFRCLYFSYDKLRDKDGIDPDDVMFQGFDGNEETNYYMYADYFVHDKGRYEEFNDAEFNSHCNKLRQYRAMLNVWKNNERYSDLSKEQIIEILNSYK